VKASDAKVEHASSDLFVDVEQPRHGGSSALDVARSGHGSHDLVATLDRGDQCVEQSPARRDVTHCAGPTRRRNDRSP
jgi:hypothetical protein